MIRVDMIDLIQTVKTVDRAEANLRIKAANVAIAAKRAELTERVYGAAMLSLPLPNPTPQLDGPG